MSLSFAFHDGRSTRSVARSGESLVRSHPALKTHPKSPCVNPSQKLFIFSSDDLPMKFRQLRSQSPWDSLSAKLSRERRGCVENPRPSPCEHRSTGRVSGGAPRSSGPLSHGEGGSLSGGSGELRNRGCSVPRRARRGRRQLGRVGPSPAPRIMAKLSQAPVCVLAGGVRGESPAPAPDRFAHPPPTAAKRPRGGRRRWGSPSVWPPES